MALYHEAEGGAQWAVGMEEVEAELQYTHSERDERGDEGGSELRSILGSVLACLLCTSNWGYNAPSTPRAQLWHWDSAFATGNTTLSTLYRRPLPRQKLEAS